MNNQHGGIMNDTLDRSFDLVIYGATGFTGALVAEYLHQTQSGLSWAIAGRSQSKLDLLKDRINAPDLETIVADSESPDDMRRLVTSTRVVISTVGPYARFGTPLVEACAAEGTHYCDLTGEPQWMASIFERVSPLAEETGARLIHCCGFDSIPSDLGVFVAQQSMMNKHGLFATKVSGRMGKSKGAVSGGTVASMLLAVEQAVSDPIARKVLNDPYGLYPSELSPGSDGPDQRGVRWDDHFESWTGPFVMAAINSKVVRRSNALASLVYGADFSYDESLLVDNRRSGLLMAGGMSIGMTALAIPPLRRLISKRLPQPGEGPSVSEQENGFFEFFVHAHHPTDSEKDVRICVKGKRDPGYGATSRMLAQAGLSLAFDDLDVEGGIWTPASALGNHLVNRLADVDITFEDVSP
ncbi:saccharopine dehydrogenase [Candidatus Paraluminiphilus aquimaris]|uniref:Saccharopine dehydrogenase n=2 Tax=Candidatus Paraluminiphilus aquimaris TaxID=2518994 RepID=A0ABY6Q8B3_9GAMM|nr:saccharopine dehydrogenase [Candidatus Paraluminiphilus aquimaris]